MPKSKVDETDIKILEEFVTDIRKGSKRIADKLKLSRQMVDYRINKMESNGTIIGYRMLVNLTKLGFLYGRLHLRLRSMTRKEKNEIIQFLVNDTKTVWVSESDGRYDLLVSFISADQYELERIVFGFLNKYHDFIEYYDVIPILELTIPTRDFSGTKTIRPIQGFMVEDASNEKVSDLDKKIINELAKNGKQSSLEIAKKIKGEPATVNYHIKQILKKKLVFSNMQLGYDVFGFELYKTLLYIKNPDRKRIEDLKKFARAHNRIWSYAETFGKWQFELDVESRGHHDYYEIMDAVQDNFSDIISSYDTIFIRKEHKLSFDVFR